MEFRPGRRGLVWCKVSTPAIDADHPLIATALDLEELAETRGGPVARHSSGGELGVLRQLVAKHAHDVDAMARDRRLNADQRTAGQLSRAIKKAGGVATLLGGS